MIIVALSGGVDSSVAALLLKQHGYHVEAVFMQNWQDNNQGECNIAEDLQDAQAVCDLLKIKLHVINFSHEYWNGVFKYFLDEYAVGHTPNPDVLCNKEIKFKAFLEHAKTLGAEYMATGHYARVDRTGRLARLLKGVDDRKDQSYFLHLLNQTQLNNTLFPLGELTKESVRKISAAAHLPNCHKKDSTGICFIGERKFRNFLGEYLLARPGEIVTSEGEIVGHHDGLMFYTIGQRKGIGIGGQKAATEAPWYVAGKNIDSNLLIVTQNKNDPSLFNDSLICQRAHWIAGEEPSFPLYCHAKIRYRHNDEACCVTRFNHVDDKLLVTFQNHQWAITPGQFVVFYQGDECLGGAVIEKSCVAS